MFFFLDSKTYQNRKLFRGIDFWTAFGWALSRCSWSLDPSPKDTINGILEYPKRQRPGTGKCCRVSDTPWARSLAKYNEIDRSRGGYTGSHMHFVNSLYIHLNVCYIRYIFPVGKSKVWQLGLVGFDWRFGLRFAIWFSLRWRTRAVLKRCAQPQP